MIKNVFSINHDVTIFQLYFWKKISCVYFSITYIFKRSKKNFIYLHLENLDQLKLTQLNLLLLIQSYCLPTPSYLFNMIPRKNPSRPTRGSDSIPLSGTKHNFFQNSYFPAAIKEWNSLDIDVQKSDSITVFKKYILSFIRTLPNKVSNSHNPQGLKLLKRLRLGLSHLRYHKFKHNFFDTINPLCSCGSDIETTFYFFLYSPNVMECRDTLLSKISETNTELITRNDLALIETFFMSIIDLVNTITQEF